MFRGVLTDVERGEMEADEPDETSHPGEASVGDQRATGGLQRTSEHVEILGQLGRAAVGPRPGGVSAASSRRWCMTARRCR